jgi:DNA polymerase-1
VNPLPKSELLKEGKFATDEATLRKLKGPAAKKYVSVLLKYAELEKLIGTYYEGIPKLNKEMHWPKGMIHGQFNQVVAKTGRLSSSKPNLQNFAGDVEDIFITRHYDT